MNFHSPSSRFTYASRAVSDDWLAFAAEHFSVVDRDCADIGCGGGIYSRALSDLGARSVIGIDSSKEILEGASEMTEGPKICYERGDAAKIPLLNESRDLVLGRALIHHLKNPPVFYEEAFRILRTEGLLVVQDRTKEDVEKPASSEHFRGYFFLAFPQLLHYERQRRPSSDAVATDLISLGFSTIEKISLWETRRTYKDLSELEVDLKQRTGRSILHELSDSELASLIALISEKTENHFPLEERDPWTIWIAKKTANKSAHATARG